MVNHSVIGVVRQVSKLLSSGVIPERDKNFAEKCVQRFDQGHKLDGASVNRLRRIVIEFSEIEEEE